MSILEASTTGSPRFTAQTAYVRLLYAAAMLPKSDRGPVPLPASKETMQVKVLPATAGPPNTGAFLPKFYEFLAMLLLVRQALQGKLNATTLERPSPLFGQAKNYKTRRTNALCPVSCLKI